MIKTSRVQEVVETESKLLPHITECKRVFYCLTFYIGIHILKKMSYSRFQNSEIKYFLIIIYLFPNDPLNQHHIVMSRRLKSLIKPN